MRDTPIASDLSQLVLEKRRREFQLETPELDSRLRNLYPLPCALVQREAYIASRETVHDPEQWDRERQQRLTERRG